MQQAEQTLAELTSAWNHFHSIWQDTQASWQDSVSLKFETKFISPLESEIPYFLLSLEKLSRELKAAERVLEED